MKNKWKQGLLCALCLVLGAALALGTAVLCGAWRRDCRETYTASDRGETVLLALEAASYVKDGAFESLGELVHPERGLLLTCASTVNLSADQWFTADEVSKLGSDGRTYIWGLDPVSGGAVEMTAPAFFSYYLYDYDYAAAPVIGVNRMAATGNALENVERVFSDAFYVDLHNPGVNGNWTTLRFVFEEYDGSPMLVALIHCRYTV